jgi:hypothetical protein
MEKERDWKKLEAIQSRTQGLLWDWSDLIFAANLSNNQLDCDHIFR